MSLKNKHSAIIILIIFILISGTLFLKHKKEDFSIVNKKEIEKPSSVSRVNLLTSSTTIIKNNSVVKVGNVKKSENIVYLNPTTITITAGDKTINQIFEKGQSLYDILVQASKSSALGLYGKEYPGLGFFVTDIGNLSAGNGKYLQYYINDKYATLGISAYVPKEGDIVTWKLE
jgi:hypothetical protein